MGPDARECGCECILSQNIGPPQICPNCSASLCSQCVHEGSQGGIICHCCRDSLVDLHREQCPVGESRAYGCERFCVIIYDITHDDCHRVVVTRHRRLYKDEDWYFGLNHIDSYMFECCLKDLNERIALKTVMRDSRARRRLYRQCEEARRNLLAGKDYAIDIMSLYQGQDYQCAFGLAACSELRDGWSTRMSLLKGAIETELSTGSTVEPKVETIILMGSWNCIKHDKSLIARCVGCYCGMCQVCVEVGGKQFCREFYRCEECGPM